MTWGVKWLRQNHFISTTSSTITRSLATIIENPSKVEAGKGEGLEPGDAFELDRGIVELGIGIQRMR